MTSFRGTSPNPRGIEVVPFPWSATPARARLRAEKVSCWFGTRKVLDRIDLAMPAGQVTALIGPSGCGKSTFLRTLNRMHELVPGASLAGAVTLDGRNIYAPDAAPSEIRLRIGMVFQRPNPFPAMSIADNVLAGLMLSGRAGRRSPEAEARLETSLRRAGLWNETKDRLRAPGGSLSGASSSASASPGPWPSTPRSS